MAKVKQIINCETNKKFIKVYDNGFIDIPDVIFYVLTEEGMMHVWGGFLHSDVPQIGKELPDDGGSLSYWIDGEKLDNLQKYFLTEGEADCEVGAKMEVDEFFIKMKQQLPYINIDTKARNIRDRVKQIVSCETNKKFIQVIDEYGIFIPDVIYHVLTEDGRMVAYGAELIDDKPRIGEELPLWSGHLKGYINDSLIQGKYKWEQENTHSEEEARRNVKDFLYNLKRQVPLLGLKEDYYKDCSWFTI